MASDQPYEGEPASEDDFVVKETVDLRGGGEQSYEYWDVGELDTIRARGISRTGGKIQFLVLESDELKHFESNDEYWTDAESRISNSIKLTETLDGEGDHVLVVKKGGPDGQETVTVEAWER